MTNEFDRLVERAQAASGDWGDEQDRSEWFEGEAQALAGRITAALTAFEELNGFEELPEPVVRGIRELRGDVKPPEQLRIEADPEPLTWDAEPLYAPETVREGLFQPEAFEQIEGQTALATDPQVVAVVRNRVRCGQEAVIFATRDAIDAAREWAADCEWLEDPEQLNELGDCAIVRGVDEHHDGGWTGFVSSLDV